MFLLMSLLTSALALASTAQDQVCNETREQHYSFATQVACVVTVKSTYYFDQKAAYVCLDLTLRDQPSAGANVTPCLQAIANKTYDGHSLGRCELFIAMGDNARAVACLRKRGTYVPPVP